MSIPRVLAVLSKFNFEKTLTIVVCFNNALTITIFQSTSKQREAVNKQLLFL